MTRRRLELLTGFGVTATIVAYLLLPGHVFATAFYNAAPPLFRTTITLLHTRNSQGQLLSDEFWIEVKNHVTVTVAAVGLSLAICFPVGIVASRVRSVKTLATNIVGIARGIPGIAVLFLMWPYLGNGEKPALIALAILAAPPIFLNTVAGYGGVDRAVVESARGMGMNLWQVLLRIESPLAAPVVVAGLRTAVVEVIASATIAAYINFDTLGTQISAAISFPGGYEQVGSHLIATAPSELALGITAIASMALVAEIAFTLFQRAVTPPSR